MRQMNEYNQTDAAKQNAEYDFPGNVEQVQTQTTVTNPSVGMLTPSTGDPIQGWLSGIFSSNIMPLRSSQLYWKLSLSI